MEPDDIASHQYDWFAPNTASGLMQAGILYIISQSKHLFTASWGLHVKLKDNHKFIFCQHVLWWLHFIFDNYYSTSMR